MKGLGQKGPGMVLAVQSGRAEVGGLETVRVQRRYDAMLLGLVGKEQVTKGAASHCHRPLEPGTWTGEHRHWSTVGGRSDSKYWAVLSPPLGKNSWADQEGSRSTSQTWYDSRPTRRAVGSSDDKLRGVGDFELRIPSWRPFRCCFEKGAWFELYHRTVSSWTTGC